MERLDTAENIFAKNKRQAQIKFNNGPSGKVYNEIFRLGFYLGMNAHREFLDEIGNLPVEDGVQQGLLMNEEVKDYINGFDSTEEDYPSTS